MGTKQKKTKEQKRELRLRLRELELELAGATARLHGVVDEMGERERRLLAELASVEARVSADVDERDARMLAAQTAVERTRVEVAEHADAFVGQIRVQEERLDRAVEEELAHLDERIRHAIEQLAASTEGAVERIGATVEQRLEELARADADARERIEACVTESERQATLLGEESAAPVAVDTTPEPPVDEVEREIRWTEPAHELGESAREIGEPGEPGETLPPSPSVDTVTYDDELAWSPPPSLSTSPSTSPNGSEPGHDSGAAAPREHAESVPAAAIPVSRAATATLSPSRAVTFEASRAHMLASLGELRRAAADGWMRVEVVHRASQGQAVASLRLGVQDLFGSCEHHDIPGRVSAGFRQAITVDASELLQAVELARPVDSTVTVVLDSNITVDSVLVLAHPDPSPAPPGERRKVERLELAPGGRDGVHLDTLAGRFVVPSRVASSLRSRRAHDIDLIMIGEQAYLSALVPGPSRDVTCTVETPLHLDTPEVHELAADRRELKESAVEQLVRALSVASSPEQLTAIATEGVGYARRRAASHPALPPDVIVAILTDGTEAMRSAAAANPSAPPAAIARAVGDTAPAVRAAVAVNPLVPPASLFALLRDESPQVRLGVACNPVVPAEMLTLLADDGDATVRAAVAAHESCPVDVLVALAGDQFPGVCARVAEHASCPRDTLEQLLSIVPEVVLSNPRAPEHVLVAGSQVASPTLRAAVAANPSTPARELQALARDPDRVVVGALATNPNAPSRVVRRARRRSEGARSSKRGAGTI